MNLAPTSTGSATAIALIFPELKGKLNGAFCASSSAFCASSSLVPHSISYPEELTPQKHCLTGSVRCRARSASSPH
jgi:hypothetical protein